MHASGKRPAYTYNLDLIGAARQTSFGKKALVFLTYAAVSAIISFGMAYWPVSAGNVLTKLYVVPNHLTFASEGSNPVNKGDRLSGASFEQRWSALPRASTEMRGDQARRQGPQAEGRIEIAQRRLERGLAAPARKVNASGRFKSAAKVCSQT